MSKELNSSEMKAFFTKPLKIYLIPIQAMIHGKKYKDTNIKHTDSCAGPSGKLHTALYF
jgi:hypothetical protein